MWMDHRAKSETEFINSLGHSVLGKISDLLLTIFDRDYRGGAVLEV